MSRCAPVKGTQWREQFQEAALCRCPRERNDPGPCSGFVLLTNVTLGLDRKAPESSDRRRCHQRVTLSKGQCAGHKEAGLAGKPIMATQQRRSLPRGLPVPSDTRALSPVCTFGDPRRGRFRAFLSVLTAVSASCAPGLCTRSAERVPLAADICFIPTLLWYPLGSFQGQYPEIHPEGRAGRLRDGVHPPPAPRGRAWFAPTGDQTPTVPATGPLGGGEQFSCFPGLVGRAPQLLAQPLRGVPRSGSFQDSPSDAGSAGQGPQSWQDPAPRQPRGAGVVSSASTPRSLCSVKLWVGESCVGGARESFLLKPPKTRGSRNLQNVLQQGVLFSQHLVQTVGHLVLVNCVLCELSVGLRLGGRGQEGCWLSVVRAAQMQGRGMGTVRSRMN